VMNLEKFFEQLKDSQLVKKKPAAQNYVVSQQFIYLFKRYSYTDPWIPFLPS
jgi:hypothetical protein